jgi:hypothetical protein
MKVYLVHESYSLLDYNYHHVCSTYQEAHELFVGVRERIFEQDEIHEILKDSKDDFYVEVSDCYMRIYITEHEVKSAEI